jgi:hypothetical protein
VLLEYRRRRHRRRRSCPAHVHRTAPLAFSPTNALALVQHALSFHACVRARQQITRRSAYVYL